MSEQMGLAAVELEQVYHDGVTGVIGKAMAKCEYALGGHTVLLVTTDSTGRPVELWAPVARLVQPERAPPGKPL